MMIWAEKFDLPDRLYGDGATNELSLTELSGSRFTLKCRLTWNTSHVNGWVPET